MPLPDNINVIVTSSAGNTVVISPTLPQTVVVNTGIIPFAISSSIASLALTALRLSGSIDSASFSAFAISSSYSSISNSASFAATSAFALNANTTGSFTGSFTGSVLGNASTADSSSYATTASAATSLTFEPISSSYATTASAATSITFIPSTASFAIATLSGSNFSGSFTGSLQGNADTATTSSAATSITFTPQTSSYALTASFAPNYLSLAGGTITGSITASVITALVTASQLYVGPGGNLPGLFGVTIENPTHGFDGRNNAITIKQNSFDVLQMFNQNATSQFFIFNPVNSLSLGAGIFTSSLILDLQGNITASNILATSFTGDGSKLININSASYSTTASSATSITFVPVTASYAQTSSFALNTPTPVSVSYAATASFAPLDTIDGDLRYVMTTGSSQMTGSLYNQGSITSSQIRLTNTPPINITAGGYSPWGANGTTQQTPFSIFYSSSGVVPERMIEVFNAGISTSNFQYNGFGFGLGRGGLISTGKIELYGIDATGSIYSIFTVARSINTAQLQLNTTTLLIGTNTTQATAQAIQSQNSKTGTSNIFGYDVTTDQVVIGNHYNNTLAGGLYFYLDSPSSSIDFHFGTLDLGLMSGSGQFGWGTIKPRATLHLVADSLSSSVEIIQGVVGQTADLLQFQTSSNGIIAKVGIDGGISASYFVGDGTNINNVISSSYARTSSFSVTAQTLLGSVVTASFAVTSSYAVNSSNVNGTGTGSFTGSLIGNASTSTTASYAVTASFALNGGGSSNTGSFTGSFTGSLLGSSSYALASNHIAQVIPLYAQFAQRILLQNLSSSILEPDAGMRIKADLTNCNQARLVTYVDQTGSNTSFIGTQYSTDQNNWNFLDGLSGTTASLSTHGIVSSSWINISGTAQQDIFIRWVAGSGSGTESPTLGTISIQVR